MKAIQRNIRHLNDDPIGCSLPDRSCKSLRAPNAGGNRRKAIHRVQGWRAEEFDLLKLAFTRCKLHLCREKPNLKNVASKGLSHGVALTAEVQAATPGARCSSLNIP